MTTSAQPAAMAAVILLVASSAPSWASETCESVFQETVQPILNANCVACHQDASPGGGLSLQRSSAPTSLLGVKSQGADLALVSPGDSSQSYLFHKIVGTHLDVGGSGTTMPIGGSLPQDEIDIIEAWIAGCEPADK